jgi:hypothetical protein
MFILPTKRVIAVAVALLAAAVLTVRPAAAAPPLQHEIKPDLAWTELDYVPRTHSMYAWIGSSRHLCLPTRSAQLMKVVTGPDRIVATGITNRSGWVNFGPRHWRGGYYVEFSEIFRFDGLNELVHCEAVRSETMYLF